MRTKETGNKRQVNERRVKIQLPNAELGTRAEFTSLPNNNKNVK